MCGVKMVWEYKTIRLQQNLNSKYPSEKEMNDLLNEYGKQGWELLAEPRLLGAGDGTSFLEFWFKRPNLGK